MNLRPSGYEPDELPDCSTPHQREPRIVLEDTAKASLRTLQPKLHTLGSFIILRKPGRSVMRAVYASNTGVGLMIFAITMK